MRAFGAQRLAVVGGTVAALPEKGPFAEVCRLSPADGGEGPRARLQRAAELAREADCQWLVAPMAGEALRRDALSLAAPALLLFDAVFGALHVETWPGTVWRPSRLAFDKAERLPHALLNWWIGTTCILRTDTALSLSAGSDDEVALLFDLWDHARCIKLAQPLWQRSDPPEPLTEGQRGAILDRLADNPVFLPVADGARAWHLPYTGCNAGIEREQTRGLFFEAQELEVLRERIGPGARIADIGANTGNHTIWFAGPMQAKRVIPFEPLPDAAAVLSHAVARNGLANVDLTKLGIGISDAPGRARVVRSRQGGLGASRLEADDHGEIVLARLDDVLTEPVDFLKIDIESMEMQALAGACETIGRHRPIIFIEIENGNTTKFLGWLEGARYRIERIFSDKGHSNFLIAPDGA